MKNIILGLWASIWVFIDEFRELLDEMSLMEFLKFTAKVLVYSVTAAVWVFAFLVAWTVM